MYYWSSNRISVLVYLFNGALICIYVSESARALVFPFEIVSKFVVRLLMFIEAQAITHTHTKCIAAHIISFSFVIAMDRRWRSRKISKFHVIRETHTHTERIFNGNAGKRTTPICVRTIKSNSVWNTCVLGCFVVVALVCASKYNDAQIS